MDHKFTKALGLSIAVFASAMAMPGVASAQEYPNRTIRIIAPTPAGGTIDYVARLLAQSFQEEFRQTVVVDNKPGANGILGFKQLTQSAPDGYTLIVANSGMIAINPATYGPKLGYDPQKELVAVASTVLTPMFLAVHPSVNAKDVRELVELEKAGGGKLAYGSGGVGSANHLAGEMLSQVAKVNLIHVPYKGGGEYLNALISGQVSFLFDSGQVATYEKAGKVRVLAVTTANRLPGYPDIPTVLESFPEFGSAVSWGGVMAPAGTPKAIVDKLNAAVDKALSSPEAQKKLATYALLRLRQTPAEFSKFIADETRKWGLVVKHAGLENSQK